jgi:phosphoglycerate dehydrogenase-like enzyme
MTDRSRLVLIVTDYLSESLDRLQVLSPMLRIEQHKSSEISEELWRDVEVLYTFTTLPAPKQAPRLRWVQLFSAGADHALRHPISSSQVVFTSVSGVHAIPVSEYVFAMLLSWSHHVPSLLEWQKSRVWPPEDVRVTKFVPQYELFGKILGIIGYGSIGRQIAKVAQSFGMRVVAMKRSTERLDHGFVFPGVGDPEGTVPYHYYAREQLHEMLGVTDIIVLSVPLTHETKKLIDEPAFLAMKPGALLVQISRGGICDEAALVRALKGGLLAGAIIDVFEQEPIPPDNPLWSLPNVMMSPHVSGHSRHYEARAAMILEENLRRYIAGAPLLNVIDRELEY